MVAFIGAPGPMEMVIIAFVVLLLFGKRVPEVMRSLGRSIVEFKRGFKEIEDIPNEINRAGTTDSRKDNDA